MRSSSILYVKDINDAWQYLDVPYGFLDFTVTGEWFENGQKQLLVREDGYCGEVINGAQVFSENKIEGVIEMKKLMSLEDTATITITGRDAVMLRQC